MTEIDVKLSQIAPSAGNATSATQVVGVQGGTTDNLFSIEQTNNGPFTSTISAGTAHVTPRSSASRWSDVINVVDFGADSTGVADSTAAIQAAINGLNTGAFGQRGKIYFPPGQYKVSPPVAGGPALTLPQQTSTTGVNGASIIIEGAGSYNGTHAGAGTTLAGIVSGTGFNGYIFDDFTFGAQQRQTSGPWVVSNLYIRNAYKPPLIYFNATANGSWIRTAATITVLNSSLPAQGISAGAIIFSTTTFSAGGVPGYVGFVKANVAVTSGTYNSGSGAVSLTLSSASGVAVGDTIAINLTGTGSVGTLNGNVVATAGSWRHYLKFYWNHRFNTDYYRRHSECGEVWRGYH